MVRRRSRRLTAMMALLAVLLGLAGLALVTAWPRPAPARPNALASHPEVVGNPPLDPGNGGQPLVIAHRGASQYRPEETLAADELAIEMGADYIEADLVSTKDGVLVARHENELSLTTDVASRPEFAARKTTKIIGGIRWTGWFTEDFTLAELRTLRTRERYPAGRPQSAAYSGQFSIPTLAEIIDLVRTDESRYHRPIGLYLETKYPAYFAGIGLPLEPALVAALRAGHFDTPGSPVYLESFDAASLRRLRGLVDLPIIQLISGRTPVTASTLDAIAGYANGIGVDRGHLPLHAPATGSPTPSGAPGPSASTAAASHPPVPSGAPAAPLTGARLVAEAHRRRLVVHVYTFTDQPPPPGSVPADLLQPGDPPGTASLLALYRGYYRLDVDGVFTDDPALARAGLAGPPPPATTPAGPPRQRFTPVDGG